jgi:Fe-S-cluster containining protein
MSKALIEKAFEKWKNDSGCRNNSCNDCQGGCNGAFIAGATWQREQLEAEIKELKFSYDTSHNADQFLIKTARTKLIQELIDFVCKDCEYNFIEDDTRECDVDPQRPDYCPQEKLIAKLDLLEKGGE